MQIKTHFTKLTTIFLVALLISGCSKNKSATGDGSGENASEISDSDLALQNRYGEGNIPKATDDGPFKDVHFGFNSSTVEPDDMIALESHAKVISGDPALKVEVEGHSDKRGTAEYNLALGERRAKSVASALVKYGAPKSQISIVSYGEEIPLDPSDSEEAYAKNRRGHFTVFKK
jgi:peptidoglycan-associated lipoprotein